MDVEVRGGPVPRVTERVQVQLTPDQLEGLDRLADRDGSSRSEQVRAAIRSHLAHRNAESAA